MNSSVHTVESVQQKIVHDQINSSSSKQQYSFPKTIRFGDSKKSYCLSASYQLDSSLNKRTTGLGYGNKSDFTKGDMNKPGPDKYSLGSIFDTSKQKKKGYTFSLGREEINFRKFGRSGSNPGPGYYEIDDSAKQRKYLFSMGGRTQNPFLSPSSKGVPGPAQYDLMGISKTGFYFHSKHSGSKASVFSPPDNTRFQYLYKNKYIPGPGAYNHESFTNEGKYYNSKLTSAAGGRFSLEPRQTKYSTKDAQNSPGPGAYRVLSEFGDTDFPVIGGSPKALLSKSQSVYSFKNSSSMRSTEKEPNYRISQSKFYTEHTQQNKNYNNQSSA